MLFVFAPFYIFLIGHRFASPKADRRQRRSVWSMNLMLLGTAALMSWIFGVWPYLLIQSIVMLVAGAAGVWLFYVQHQFEDAYWERGDDWDYTAAALRGSSFYKLPSVLQWFSANIGFHHIHHLNPHVPNYRLAACHRAIPALRDVPTLGIRSGMRALSFVLWDEERARMVSFRAAAACPVRRA